MEISKLKALKLRLDGDLLYDELTSLIYATDASVYRIKPLAVAFPKTENDLVELIKFANTHAVGIVPRAAGTSLAGQCVGKGIIVDISRYFTAILKFDAKEKTVTVQPGVVRDSLNNFLKPHGLFFGPNTSTSNRCTIGGMVGNNSSGTTSIQYGVTRDKIIALKTVLSDASTAVFKSIGPDEFTAKTKLNTLEGRIYNKIEALLSDTATQKLIKTHFPKPEIHRRNTGYAIDELVQSQHFTKDSKKPFNLCDLLTGSEGTLAFTTEITLKLDALPPENKAVVALHFESISACLESVQLAMSHNLYTCEMMDKTILDCTLANKTQHQNRFFIEGDPKAVLLCELRAATENKLKQNIEAFLDTMDRSKLSYASPVIYGDDISRVLELRSAGLGLLGNLVGDKKAVACIEDTAVALPDLANYITEFTALMRKYKQNAVYYAHAGAGELHLRPILD